MTLDALREKGLAKRKLPVKVLGNGELKGGLTIEADAFSKSAVAKIEKAGGKAVVQGAPGRPRSGGPGRTEPQRGEARPGASKKA